MYWARIILPVSALLDQYKATESRVIKQFDLAFILHSIERLDEDDRRALLPKALAGSASTSFGSQAAGFLGLVFRLLLDVRIPPRGSKDDEAFREGSGLSNEADAKYLAEAIGIFIRLKLPNAQTSWQSSNPGLSTTEIESFAVDNPSTHKIFGRISELKSKLVVFLASGAFTDEEKFLPALYGASTPDNKVSSTAEEIIKRSSVSLENEDLVVRLFEAHAKLPAAYRTRILGMLAKSALSTTKSDRVMEVVRLDFMEENVESSVSPVSSLERTKLHKALFHYLSWVAKMGQTHQRHFAHGAQIIEMMKSYVESQGWPKPEKVSQDDAMLRSRAYETIGTLARTATMPVENRLQLAEWLFRSLSEDTVTDAVVNIDGALSSLTGSISPEIGAQQKSLKSMLLHFFMLSDDPPAVRSTRHAVVKWANQCLPYSDVYARWIDILAVGTQHIQRPDVVEQGRKGMDPWTYFAHVEKSPALPDWRLMMVTFFGSQIDPKRHPEHGSSIALVGRESFVNFPGHWSAAYSTALRFCKDIMFLTALTDFQVQHGWQARLGALMKNDVNTRATVREYLRSVDSGQVRALLAACLSGSFAEDSPEIAERSLVIFYEIAALSSQNALARLSEQAGSLLSLVKSNRAHTRSAAASAIGVLSAHPSNDTDKVVSWRHSLKSLWENGDNAAGPDLNAAEGALLAWGNMVSRSVYYNRSDLIPEFSEYPFKFLIGKTPSSLQNTAFMSFAELWSAGCAFPSDSSPSLTEIIDALESQAKKGNESAMKALGRLAVASPDDATIAAVEGSDDEQWQQGPTGTILQKLFALHEIKQAEIHFTVGEAIAVAIARWDSDSAKVCLDVEPSTDAFRLGARRQLITSVLSKLFKDCKATKPSLLKASGIWLFSIVQYCSHLDEVQSRLREAQAAFMRLLSARDELVQETASRGLSLVYERGDEELKSTLVKDLVSAFTGTSTQLKVEQDTELFEPGALPTGEGSSVTSYKDIVNLANEVGDQRLVYKFMSLAANAATWSTRSAFGRFGLSNILSDSEVDPKLYPKLFRYRYDPNKNVQRSMEDIWKSLVKDSGSVIDTHFDAILDDLLKNILGREWRVREASCAAIADLLQGRPFNKYESRYRDIWRAATKVLDDVKGSVREAALKLCMGLSTNLQRQLEEGNNLAAAKAMMAEALPFLLSENGAGSSVKDVQLFATMSVLDIAKKGGKALKPFIPAMVQELLGLLSTIEPEQINYHYQRAGEDNRDKIDKLRSQMVNRSPISEAIDNCLRFVDAEVMEKLAPGLEATIKTAIGMPTKIGCSRVLTTLFTRHVQDIEHVSGRFLGLMEKQVIDKNDEVSQAYARASGYMIRAVSDASKQRFFDRIMDMYFHAEEETRRQKVSDVVMAISKASPDHFTANQGRLLPFAYLGSHDTDDYTSKMFKLVWEQHAGSTRTVARYVPEIVALVERCMDTAQWALRHGGAFTVGSMAADVANASTATSQISEADLKLIWPMFDKALAMKTFAGKEKVLESFPIFISKGRALWTSDAQVAAQMKKVAIREAKRNNDEYRPHAFTALWKFAEARDDLDLFEDIVTIIEPHLDALKEEDSDKMDVDSKEDLVIKAARHGVEALARGYSRPKAKSDPSTTLSQIIKALKPYLLSTKFAQIKREIWYCCVKDVMADISASTTGASAADTPLAMEYLQSLDLEQGEEGIESHRLKRADAVLETLKAVSAGKLSLGPLKGDVETQLKGLLTSERSLDVQKVWRNCIDKL